jgi:hypothetical protein
VKCGFFDHVSSNDGSAVKLSEDEEDEWCHLQPLGTQFEDYTCDSAPEVFEVQNVDQVLDQQLIRPEEQEEEVAEDKKHFFGCTERIGSSQKGHVPV